MIYLKTAEEIALLKISNQILSKTFAEVAKHIKPGVSLLELDKIAEDFIRTNDAEPGCLNYNGFPNTLCTSVNEQVVHGIPSDYKLKEGDILSVDSCVKYKGFYSDSAYTFAVGEIDPKVQKLLDVTKESLFLGISQAVAGNRLGDIGYAIQHHCESSGFSVVREMVGHGIGRNMHESPEVPNVGKRGQGIVLKEGMVIAIEPMINMGNKRIVQEKDGWTIRSIDRKPSAHFEHSVAIHEGQAEILSTFEYIEEVLRSK